MATTVKQLLNRLKVSLREDEIPDSISTLTEEYDLLLLELVNQIKDEIESAHQWRTLRHTETVTIPAAGSTVEIPNTDDTSRVYRVMDNDFNPTHRALVFDVTNTNDPDPVKEMPLPELLRRRSIDPDFDSDDINYFALDDVSDTGQDTLNLEIYPNTRAAANVTVTLITPQPTLVKDALDTIIEIPIRTLLQGALWYALEERGEELGQGVNFASQRFVTSLQDSITRDMTEQGGMDLILA